jgi:hypothetical protein
MNIGENMSKFINRLIVIVKHIFSILSNISILIEFSIIFHDKNIV